MPDSPTDSTTHARAHREGAEAEILSILKKLCQLTRMDLDRVHVLTVVDTRPGTDEPQVIPYAVKIVLAV